MDFIGFTQAYDKYGCSRIFSPIADLLEVRLDGEYGTAVTSLYFTAILPSRSSKPRPTLEELFERFHHGLTRLPKVTFRRQLKRIEIEFQSQHFVAEDDESNKLSPKKCNVAANEVAAALQLIKKRVKAEDDFDVCRFLADACNLLSTRIDSLEEWEEVEREGRAKQLALRATKTPWELLEIDWTKFHPRAKELLDDPLFWECADDRAPHGNDTGADLLEEFCRWNKRNRNSAPMAFLKRLLKRWDIEPIDWNVIDEDSVRRLQKEQSISFQLCNEAVVALAFAVVKLRGRCPTDLIQIALAAMARTSVAVDDSNLTSEIKKSWAEAIAKMRSKLESLQAL